MKKIVQTCVIILFASATVVMNGCKKEGPAGPPGNANVTARTFSATSWSWSSPYYYANFSVPELTSANAGSAAVMVYFHTTSNSWLALPYSQYNSPYNYYMGFSSAAGLVQVTWVYDYSLSSGDDPNTYYGSNVQYKVVIIPPAERKANPDLDLTDYNAVKEAYHLED